MINVNTVTNYNRTGYELEEFLVFSICVANKPAPRIAESVDKLLKDMHWQAHPLLSIRDYCRSQGVKRFAAKLHHYGITPHNQKAGFLYDAARAVHNKGLMLRTCTLEQLMEIKGVSHKTANFFLTHSREDYDYPVLDTHILKFLRDCGVDAPMATPSSPKRYKELAEEFMRHVPEGCSVADYDLYLWRKYSGN